MRKGEGRRVPSVAVWLLMDSMSAQRSTILPPLYTLCSLRCTEVQPLLEAVSYKGIYICVCMCVYIYIYSFFSCFKIFGGGEQA